MDVFDDRLFPNPRMFATSPKFAGIFPLISQKLRLAHQTVLKSGPFKIESRVRLTSGARGTLTGYALEGSGGMVKVLALVYLDRAMDELVRLVAVPVENVRLA